jgi:endonuclease III
MNESFPYSKVVEQLKNYYKNDVPALTRIATERNSPFLVLIGCLLSLRTKDETTDVAMERLMKSVSTPHDLIKVPTADLEKIIYPVGFYRNKARLIKEVAQTVIEKYHDQVPDTIEELVTIRGIGRKTANIVVTEGFGKAGIAVDTHVHRISNRMGAVKTRNPDETEQALRQALPPEYWRAYNPLLVTHGRRTCTPLSPFCSRCPISDLCEKVGVTKSR